MGGTALSLAPGECDEETVLRSRVFLSGSDQVLGDTPPRKPFNTLVESGRFGPATLGSTAARSNSSVCEYSASGDFSVWKSPCSL